MGCFNKQTTYDKFLRTVNIAKADNDCIDADFRRDTKPVKVHTDANRVSAAPNIGAIQTLNANRNTTGMHARRVRDQSKLIVEFIEAEPGNAHTIDIKQVF